MKEHSNNFETEIKTYGRQQAVQVIFEQDGQEVVLDNENVFSVTPNFKASLLKSAMKSLILDCNVEIPVGTRLQFRYGILVNNAYEYLDFGYYIVNKIEKKEDTRSYEITCYDKMMLAMVDYIDLGINYPITIRNYINSICNHLEINFGNNEDQFINYDKQIPSELYLDENGNSLDYTFRDVLDELAQVTASVICIDENDNLVVKYPQLNGEYETIEGTSLYIENADDNKIDLELKGNTTQNGTPTPSSPIPVNNVTGEQVVRVCGKNLFDGQLELGGYGSTGAKVEANANYRNANTILVEPSTTYTFSINGASQKYIILFYDINGNFISQNTSLTTGTFTTLNNTYFINFRTFNADFVSDFSNLKVQLEKGSSATTYELYQGKDYEINLGKNLANPSDFKFYTQTNASCSYDYNTNTLTMTTLRTTTSNNLFFCSKIDDNLLKNGKTYTISSVDVSGVYKSLKLQLRNKDESYANKSAATSVTYDNTYSLYIVENPFASSGSTTVPQGSVAVIKDIQVEERKCSN